MQLSFGEGSPPGRGPAPPGAAAGNGPPPGAASGKGLGRLGRLMAGMALGGPGSGSSAPQPGAAPPPPLPQQQQQQQQPAARPGPASAGARGSTVAALPLAAASRGQPVPGSNAWGPAGLQPSTELRGSGAGGSGGLTIWPTLGQQQQQQQQQGRQVGGASWASVAKQPSPTPGGAAPGGIDPRLRSRWAQQAAAMRGLPCALLPLRSWGRSRILQR